MWYQASYGNTICSSILTHKPTDSANAYRIKSISESLLFLFFQSEKSQGASELSRKLMHQALVKLGFTETEAKVYVQLTTEGPQCSRDIAKALNLNTRQVCTSLKKMQSRGFVEADQKCQTPFVAVPIQKVLNLLIKDNIEQAKYVMRNKEELLSSWRSIIKKEYLST